MTPHRRIVLLGIDGANPQLLRQWARDGILPNLADLMSRGLSATTESLPGFFIGATWPSLYTGTSPAHHGFHYQLQLRPGTYDLYRPEQTHLVRSPPFWQHVSRASKRVAVLDVPLSQIDTSINGVQTVEWGGHDAVYGFQTFPPALAAHIHERFGDHPLGPTCDGVRKSADDYAALVEKLVEGVRKKGQITRDVLGRERWDLFVQVFTETHCAGHQCWHLHDAGHPEHDAEIVARIGDPLRSVYVAVDRAIGEIVQDAGDALIVVLSAHGMASFYGAQFMLRDILLKLGVMKDAQPPPSAPAKEPLWVSFASAAWRSLPKSLRAHLAPLRALHQGTQRTPPPDPTLGIDADNSPCFPLSNGLGVGGIRLNIAGREPAGVLKSGDDVEAFVAQLSADLLAIVDGRTGAPLVRRVLRTRELYRGPLIDALPDLLVEWNDEVTTGSTNVGKGRAARITAHSDKLGRIEKANGYSRTGEHRTEGLLVAVGPGVTAGEIARHISVLDLAPTFCKLLDVDFPGGEGQPIAELISARASSAPAGR